MRCVDVITTVSCCDICLQLVQVQFFQWRLVVHKPLLWTIMDSLSWYILTFLLGQPSAGSRSNVSMLWLKDWVPQLGICVGTSVLTSNCTCSSLLMTSRQIISGLWNEWSVWKSYLIVCCDRILLLVRCLWHLRHNLASSNSRMRVNIELWLHQICDGDGEGAGRLAVGMQIMSWCCCCFSVCSYFFRAFCIPRATQVGDFMQCNGVIFHLYAVGKTQFFHSTSSIVSLKYVCNFDNLIHVHQKAITTNNDTIWISVPIKTVYWHMFCKRCIVYKETSFACSGRWLKAFKFPTS